MVCSSVDRWLRDGKDVPNSDVGFASLMAVFAVSSLGVAFAGSRIMRPLAFVVSGTVVAVVVFEVVPLPCNVLLIAASASGLVVACATLCVLRASLVVVCAAAFGAATHLVWSAVGVGGYEVYAVACGTVVGGAVAFWRKVSIVPTAVLGGCGVALVTSLSSSRSGAPVPDPALASIAAVVACVGVCVQRRIRS